MPIEKTNELSEKKNQNYLILIYEVRNVYLSCLRLIFFNIILKRK